MQTHYLNFGPLVGASSVAYDLEKFQTRSKQRGRKPKLRVAAPSAKARAKAKMMLFVKVMAALAVGILIVVTMLYSRAVLTELSQQVASKYNELEELKSENIRLQAQLESAVSLRNIEEYATQRLGMSAMDKQQVTYINLSEGDQIELTDQSPKQTLFDRIRIVVNDLEEYIPEQENIDGV